MPRPPSTLRLVNLALGLSAVADVIGSLLALPYLVPSRWVMQEWLSPSTLATVPVPVLLSARIAVDLWLPASLLLLVFWLAGLNRHAAQSAPGWAAPTLALGWLCCLAAKCVPLTSHHGEAADVALVFITVLLSPVYLGICAAAGVAAVKELAAMTRERVAGPQGSSWRALLCWVVFPPILWLLPLLTLHTSPFAMAAGQKRQFDALCRSAGVRYLDKPSAPVRSVAYDWNPEQSKSRPSVDRIATDGRGHVLAYESTGSTGSLALDFTESRRDPLRAGAARINPGAPYYHFPNPHGGAPYYGVDALTADALAFLQAEDLGPLAGASGHVMRYQLALTDRRSGAPLGVQTFLVDKGDGRACGVNLGTAISQDAFIDVAIHR